MRYLKLQDNNEYKYCYKIADSLYQSDTPINGLEYLLQAHFQFGNNTKSSISTNHKPATAFNKISYQQLTPIGENIYPLQVLTNAKGNYKVKVKSDLFCIDKNTVIADIAKIDMTILMGPVFILQLAQNQVFCLHASAFIVKNTCFILMANSGTGKSTIARHIQQSHFGNRIADDIVPIKIVKDKITLLASFPQLKLNQEQQYKGDDICQNTVLLFTQKSTSKTTLLNIDRFIAIKKLIQHSVATKLFSGQELHNHLLFCHKTSEQTQAYQLNYQHSKNSLKELQDLLDDIS